jgi:hypothetical protein
VSSGGSESGDESSTQGADPRVEAFGREAASGDRAAIVAAMKGYLQALAVQDYRRACSSLATSVQRSLERIVAKQVRARGCAAILPMILSGAAATTSREAAAGAVSRVRVSGNRALVLYHAPGAQLYVMTMTREGSAWKAATIAGSILIPSAGATGAG